MMRQADFMCFCALCASAVSPSGVAGSLDFDAIVRNGSIYDGSGGAPFKADIGIKADRIAAVGDLSGASAGSVVEAKGLAVAPGFINMLSWSTASLIIDGRSQSEIRQGVTTEIFGEGTSMGPLTEEMKRRIISSQGELKFDICWTTLSQYLSYLEKRGISPNIASFVGAGTVRENVIGLENKKATPAQLDKMCELVRSRWRPGRWASAPRWVMRRTCLRQPMSSSLCAALRQVRRNVYLSHAKRRRPFDRSG